MRNDLLCGESKDFVFGSNVVNFKLQCGTWPWNTLQNGPSFHYFCLGLLHPHFVAVGSEGKWLTHLAPSFAMIICWDSVVVMGSSQCLLARRAACFLSIFVVLGTSSARDGQAVCCSNFRCCQVLNLVVDVSGPHLDPRWPCPRQESLLFLWGCLFRFAWSASITGWYGRISPVK